MLKKLISNKLFWIFVIALIVRIWKLETLPSGIHVDEIKVAWNSLSILNSGLDDKNEVMGLYYDTFGDFRPSGIFYITTIFLKIFGENMFAVRFTSAFFGALTITSLSILVDEIAKHKKKPHKTSIGNLAAIILALSPWHIATSRTTNEAVISTFFVTCVLLFFIRFLKTRNNNSLIASLLCSVVAMSLYHSARLEIPIFVTATFVIYEWRVYRQKTKRYVHTPVLLFIVAIITTMFYFTSSSGGLNRLEQVSIFKKIDTQYELTRLRNENTNGSKLFVLFDNKYLVYSKSLVISYVEYFSPQFLVGSAAKPHRYTTPGVGLIYFADILLIVLGVVQIAKSKREILPLILMLLAPISASITYEDSPNLQRSLLMLPFMCATMAYGASVLIEYKSKIISLAFGFLYLLSFLYFAHMYINHTISQKPFLRDFILDNPSYRNSGSKELGVEIHNLKDRYQKIIVSGFPDNIYPWYAFLNGINPSEFNSLSYKKGSNVREWKNIVFTDKPCPSDFAFDEYEEKNILVVNSWICGYESQIKAGLSAKVVHKIYRSDKGEAYIFMERLGR